MKFNKTKETHHFNWRQIISNPSRIMFFGPPRETSRAFDDIFKNAKLLDTMHLLFLTYYDEFEGDVSACLSLLNSYLSRRVVLLEKQLSQEQKSKKTFDGNIFLSDSVNDFLQRFDIKCKESMEYCMTHFVNHTEPLVPTSTMREFIDAAPGVFGELWDLMCHLRGVHKTWSHESHLTLVKEQEIFFQLLALARMANRSKLLHCAMIGTFFPNRPKPGHVGLRRNSSMHFLFTRKKN